jgi:hypothetical protein
MVEQTRWSHEINNDGFRIIWRGVMLSACCSSPEPTSTSIG